MHAPGCETNELVRLMRLHKVGEPPGDPGHNIGYDHDVIEICPSCNGATLEALRHDCFDFEDVWDQYEWYELSPDDGVKLRAIAARCERPLDPFCNCDVHKTLRESARSLPRSSWDTIFEASHRHVVTISDGKSPKFSINVELTELLRVRKELEEPVPPPTPGSPKPPDARAVGFIFIAWPAALAASIYAWTRWVRLPWVVDVVALLLAIPATFVVSGVLLAATESIFVRERRRTPAP